MLGEIIQLVTFAFEFVSKRKAESKGWSKIYQLYLSLGDVIGKSENAINHYLPFLLDPPQKGGFVGPIEKWANTTNEDFEKLQESVMSFLKLFGELADLLEIYDERMERKIDFHIKWKTRWYAIFMESYISGEITSDGKKIKRRWLKYEDDPAQGAKDLLRHADVTEKYLIEELIDISTEEKRTKLIELGQRNIEELKKVKADLAVFIRENCKLEDLL